MPQRQIKQYLQSPSTLIGLSMGLVMYLSYASVHTQFLNPVLIGVTLFVGICLPAYSRLSNKVEEWTNLRFALVTFGRLGRFGLQVTFNGIVFLLFLRGHVLPAGSLDGLGGPAGAALLTTLASQGAQYLAVIAFNRGIGDLNRNVLAALSANIVATAIATAGLPEARLVFIAGSLALGALIFGVGILSDLRGLFFPRRGVGLFLGTFNPFHATHAAILAAAIRERGLSVVLVHPTVVPKLHADAFRRGEIRVGRIEGGLAVLERTDKADLNVNYFPTGNRFYPPQTRKLMIELALEEAGLSDRVKVLWLPDIYRDHGFHGVVAQVRRLYPGCPLHGIHGSDLGGMWVRAIYDESGWIYPYPVRRRDNVSATAIRNGAQGMTSQAVTGVLAGLRAGAEIIEVGGRRLLNRDGHLSPNQN